MSENLSDRPYDIIAFADTCVDILMTGADVVPRFGQVEKLVDDYAVQMGGSCCIFACQAARLGLRVALLGRVGDDDFGRLTLRCLNECGVDTRHMVVDPALKTGMGIALCQEDDRAILTYLGSACAVERGDISDAFLASARHMHYGSFFLHTRLRPHAPDIFRRAKALGLTISLDTNWDPEERWNSALPEVLPLTDILMPNEPEVCHIAGCSVLEEAIACLCQRGVSIVTLKLGAGGARVYDGKSIHECTIAPAEAGGDSVGAGDSFDAGFLAGWLRGMSIDRCLEIACLCGRSVAGAVGGVAGQPDWETVSRLAGTRIAVVEEKLR